MKTLIQKDTRTPMFIAALFIIAKTWKQPKCPSTDDWLKMRYIYTMGCYSAIKKRMKYCHLQQHGWTYRTLYLVKLSQTEKDKYYLISLIHGI